MKRRHLLATAGSALTVSSVGCLGFFEDEEQTVRLGQVTVNNADVEPHEIQVEVHRDGEVVHQSGEEVSAMEDNRMGGYVAECTWGDTPGEYTVVAEADGESTESNLTQRYGDYADCVVAMVMYREQDGLLILSADNCDLAESDTACAFAKE